MSGACLVGGIVLCCAGHWVFGAILICLGLRLGLGAYESQPPVRHTYRD